MSYILDALKKSEAERRAAAPAGGVSGAVYVVDAAPAFAGWRPLGAAALVLVVLAAVVLWRTGERSEMIAAGPAALAPASPAAPPAVPAESPASPAVPSAVPAESPAPLPPTLPVVVARPQPDGDPGLARRSLSGDAPVGSNASGAKSAGAKSSGAKAAGGKAPAADGDRPVRVRQRPETVVPRPPIVAANAPVSAPASSLPAASPPTASAPVVSAAVVSRTPGAAASSARVVPTGATSEEAPAGAVAPPRPSVAVPAGDVPSSPAAGELPRLVVSGFAGGEDRDARFAVINDRIVREGEEFAPDLRLTHVGQDGVVVEYRGKRYRP